MDIRTPRAAGRVGLRCLGAWFSFIAGCAVVEAPKAGSGSVAHHAASTEATASPPATPTSPASAASPASPASPASCAPEAPSTPAGARCLGSAGGPEKPESRSVLGGPLQACPSRHRAGFYRDGYCHTGDDDHGVHVICARVTDAFLAFSRARGNDLVTPRGGFPGLKDGDGWCLCAGRWQEAHEAGVAPPVVVEATHEAALRTARLEDLDRARAR
jgi:uncharacterized protein (DUF2237 family)